MVKNFQEFQTIKLPIKGVLKDPDKHLPIILNYVQNAHLNVVLAYQLIRLYVLYQFKSGNPLPKLTKHFCETALNTIADPDKKITQPKTKSKTNSKSKKPRATTNQYRQELQQFYHTEFKSVVPENLEFEPGKLSSVRPALALEMETSYNNNLKIHFIERLKRVIKHQITKHPTYKDLSKGQIARGAALVISAIYDRDLSELPKGLHEIYQNCLKEYLPAKFEKSLPYDLEKNTDQYLFFSLKLDQYLETNEAKLFQPLCLRTSNVPGHIPIDTKSLIYLMDDCTQAMDGYRTKTQLLNNYTDELVRYGLWSYYFNLDHKVFKNKPRFEFFHEFKTDGVSISLLFINKLYKPVVLNFFRKKNNKLPVSDEIKQILKQKKLDDSKPPPETKTPVNLTPKERDFYQKIERKVANDPGLQNLLMLVEEPKDDKKGKHLIFTKQQWYQESHITRNQNMNLKLKKANGIQTIEQPLDDYNSKSVNYTYFKDYLKVKNQIMIATQDHYNSLVFRKNRFRRFHHGLVAIKRLLTNIYTLFGDCLIFWGNYSRTQHKKYNAPVPLKWLKKSVEERFWILTTNECNTSSKCYWCQKEVENNKKNGEKQHRCLICKECFSLPNGKKGSRYINRDIMGALNISRLGKCDLYQQERPEAYQRRQATKGNEDPFGSLSKTVPVISKPLKVKVI